VLANRLEQSVQSLIFLTTPYQCKTNKRRDVLFSRCDATADDVTVKASTICYQTFTQTLLSGFYDASLDHTGNYMNDIKGDAIGALES
jgi:hypothetical protein